MEGKRDVNGNGRFASSENGYLERGSDAGGHLTFKKGERGFNNKKALD